MWQGVVEEAVVVVVERGVCVAVVDDQRSFEANRQRDCIFWRELEMWLRRLRWRRECVCVWIEGEAVCRVVDGMMGKV